MNNLKQSDVDELLAADHDELLALLGATALPLIGSPVELLSEGRQGTFYSPRPAVLGDEGPAPLQHRGLQRVATRFLAEWGSQIKMAVCGKDAEFEAAKKNGATILVGSVVSTITIHVPELAPYTSLVTVLAVIIIQSGFRSFCTD